MTKYVWKIISDLPDDWDRLLTEDLSSLAEIWQEHKEKLHGSDALKTFNEQLQREWAIETGIIEGLYTLDRGTTQLLIERGIEGSLIPHGASDKAVSEILPIMKDQESVVKGLFDFVGQSRLLSTSYIKELHQMLTAHQYTVDAVDPFGRVMKMELKRGQWKTSSNNPTRSDGSVHEYCPPEHVASEMDRLIAMHEEQRAAGVSPEAAAAWLHHRFTQIHPFQDGNGRVARSLASLVFLRAGWFPLVIISDKHRNDYIKACEDADDGNLQPLVRLFTGIQKQAFIQALSISGEIIEDSEAMQAVIAAAVKRIKGRAEEVSTDKKAVFETSEKLEDNTNDKLQSLSLELRSQLAGIDDSYCIETDRSTENTSHWFMDQVISIAEDLNYFADMRSYHGWNRLTIKKTNQRQTEIVISFHSLGMDFSGVLTVLAFVVHRSVMEDHNPSLDGPYAICSDVFQFSCNQDVEKTEERFNLWINKVLVAGLDQWRRQL
ncbi:MAG: Fic family protein [Candidatus Hydrogenedens sp.]|jgi:Fic family protein|nr:Fic family protein [Candidatus Hydrogenedens sp.]